MRRQSSRRESVTLAGTAKTVTAAAPIAATITIDPTRTTFPCLQTEPRMPTAFLMANTVPRVIRGANPLFARPGAKHRADADLCSARPSCGHRTGDHHRGRCVPSKARFAPPCSQRRPTTPAQNGRSGPIIGTIRFSTPHAQVRSTGRHASSPTRRLTSLLAKAKRASPLGATRSANVRGRAASRKKTETSHRNSRSKANSLRAEALKLLF